MTLYQWLLIAAAFLAFVVNVTRIYKADKKPIP